MAAIIICKKPDGAVYVNAVPDDIAAQLEADAVPAASVEEAAKLATDTLNEGGAAPGEGEQPQAQAEPQEQEAPEGAEGMPMESREDEMAAGFARAKKGY